jgi:hypothetical protein
MKRMKQVPNSDAELGGSDSLGTFGRQNRTNTRVTPAQIEVFVRGLFSDLDSAVPSSTEPYGGAQVNGAPIFTGERCACFCVHPCRRIAERERYFLVRILPVFRCSAALNNMAGERYG